MYVRDLHAWDIAIPEARALQERLATQIVEIPPPGFHPRLIAGADMSHQRGSPCLYGAVVLWDRETGQLVETATARTPAVFPYVPGFLSFREGPVLLDAFRKLKRRPDAVLFDGQGRAHPRSLGLACHLGCWIDLPSVGCAKTRFCGEYTEPGSDAGSTAPLTHGGHRIGTVLRTRRGSKPVFVSVGHRIDLAAAEKLILDSLRGYRLPEPSRQAHLVVNKFRRSCENP